MTLLICTSVIPLPTRGITSNSLANTRYYLKSRFYIVRLISCLPKSNKGMKDDYLIVSWEWHDGLHCPVLAGKPGGVP